jgi:hypothetical protein
VLAAAGGASIAFWLGFMARPAPGRTLRDEPARKESVIDAPASKVVADQAIGLVNAARTSKRWTLEDRTLLRQLSRQLSAEQYDGVLRTLVRALNAGDLQPDFDGPPM